MKNSFDLRQLLKKFGSFVYTGSQIADLEMMEMEIMELFELKLISIQEYQQALLIIRKEKGNLKNKV